MWNTTLSRASDDKVSVGRIVLFGLVVSAFFTTIFTMMTYMIEGISGIPNIMKSFSGEPETMKDLWSITSTIGGWIKKIFTSEIGFAVILLVGILYTILTEHD